VVSGGRGYPRAGGPGVSVIPKLPAIYSHLVQPSEKYFGWRLAVYRTDPRDSAGSVLRDLQGQPVERPVPVYASLPAAVCPPSVSDQERFEQRQETLSATIYLRRLTPEGPLPDVRHQDRLTDLGWPGGPDPGSHYYEVLEHNDVGRAGLLLEIHVSERKEGSG
jgi:hypothetical protein